MQDREWSSDTPYQLRFACDHHLVSEVPGDVGHELRWNPIDYRPKLRIRYGTQPLEPLPCQAWPPSTETAADQLRQVEGGWRVTSLPIKEYATPRFLIPIHFERAVKPSFPRRACPVPDTGREPTPWPHIYGGITVIWYYLSDRLERRWMQGISLACCH